MALNYHYPVVNPRLGTSFAIFTSAYVSLVLTLLILEQLGLETFWITQVMVLVPIMFYGVIGMLVRTTNLEDFFVAGERVPALYNGLSLSANILGGTAIATSIGALLLLGFDALPLVLGWCAGIAVVSLLFAPYLRKAGSFTLPSFLGMRYSSRGLRALSALLMAVPLLMLLAAELKVGAMIGALFVPLPQDMLIAIGAGIAAFSVLPGGMRSLTWMQCAQVIVLILGLLAPLVIVSLELTNLPIPQLSYGGVLENAAELEAAKGVGAAEPGTLSGALTAGGPQLLQKPFLQAFGAFGPLEFLLLGLCVMAGTAMLPSHFARLSSTPTIMAARGSIGWAVLIVALAALSLPAYAAFTHFYLVRDAIGMPFADMPGWTRLAADLGLISINTDTLDPAFGMANALVNRDLAALLLPTAAALPQVFSGVVVAGILAAVLAATAGHLVALGNSISNDLFHPFSSRPATSAHRLIVARLGIIVAAITAAMLARSLSVDPLAWMLWALSLVAASFFAVTALSIWWRRTSAAGVYAGLLAGYGTTALYIIGAGAEGASLLGIDALCAGIIGVPASLVAAVAVTILTPRPDSFTADIAEEIRVSGGETLHARLLRLSGRGKAPRP